jgi:threonine dehydratase
MSDHSRMDLDRPVTLADVQAARVRVADRVHRTPLFASGTLSRRLGVPAYVKTENLQKTGSFKPRGATNAIRLLPPEARRRGVVTFSAGNHAQALAYAAAAEGVNCTVVMPATAVASKVEACRAYGADVVLRGTPHDAMAHFQALQESRGLIPVHPFDHPHVIAGQGTVALEIFDDVPDAALVVVPIGGGGLIGGMAIALRGLGAAVRIVGVETTGSNAMGAALAAGRPVTLDRIDSIADGLGAPSVTARTLEIAQRHVDAVVEVPDAALLEAMRFALERLKLVLEPAGAAGLAAVLGGHAGALPGPVVIVLSGGNVDLTRLKAWL